METYREKIRELNKDGKTVLDSIDRPIRGLIIELNRVGLQTRFSCCGFPYRGEEEPKSHARYPFVVLEPPLREDNKHRNASVPAFFTLAENLPRGWILQPYQRGQWHLNAEQLMKNESSFYPRLGNLRGLHDYETSLISIQILTRLVRRFPNVSEEFSIIDGNTGYGEHTKNEWQVDSKLPVMISCDD